MTDVTRRVFWTVTAKEDLSAIVNWIADENPVAAREVLGRLRDAAQRLRSFPEQGRVVPELCQHGIEFYRELVVSPWRIVYRSDEKFVQVMAVLDSRRNLEDLLLDRMTRSHPTH